jgi:dTDP-4-dehydrorhamnose reductase
MRVLITGGSGQLGHALLASAPPTIAAIAPTRAELDLAATSELTRQLAAIAPDAIINAAAYTAVDGAESEPELAEEVNAQAPGIIAQYCHEHSLPLIHVSTDFVFDGQRHLPYTTSDTPKPMGVYSTTKLAGETAVQLHHPDAYIVRTSWVYSEHGNNFVKTMLRLAAAGTPLSIVDDQIGAPTYAKNLAFAIWSILEKRPKDQILHISDAGQISWYDFAIAIFEEGCAAGLLGTEPGVTPIASADYGAPAPRPAYSVLDCRSSYAQLGLQQRQWREALRDMLGQLTAKSATIE